MQLSLYYDYGNIKQYNDLLNNGMTTPSKYSLRGWGTSLDILKGDDFSLKIGVGFDFK